MGPQLSGRASHALGGIDVKVDSYYPLGVRLSEVGAVAHQAERAGFDALWAAETRHSPFLACGAALAATRDMLAGTGIAVAFPRSPMVTAQAAWDLAELGRGRFVLGLGTQVKAHVTRRFSAPFDQPVARMREYVHALRAIFGAFQGEGRLKFSGDFYRFSLLTDFFNPGPAEYPEIPMWLAAVGPAMLRLAGECCDGAFLHPLNSAEYLRATVLPMVEAGAAAAGRARADVTLCCPVFVAVGDTQEEIDEQRADIAQQIAFYGSTRTYRPVFETHGWGDVTDRLHVLLARGDTEGMAAAITGEILDAFSVTATWDGLAAALTSRYGGLVDRIAPYGVDLRPPGAADRWRDVIAGMRARPGQPAGNP
jgi:probable F420-dependent oxidoreductase